MKRLIHLVILLATLGRLPAQSTGSTLSGDVTDSLTGIPVADVSIYLNNTSRGTVSKKDGSFQFTVPPGSWQLVFSAIGYATRIIDINTNAAAATLRIRLVRSATQLTEITVEPDDNGGWRKYGKYFRDNFIGTGPNASSCKILNREVLRFHFYKRSNRLGVTATGPLHIENDALGYVLEYKLEGFVSDFNENIVTWQGYPFFREQTAKNKDKEQSWFRNRRYTYMGSMMHFMRSLFAGHTLRESFYIQRDVVVPNGEKRRVRNIYRPDFQKPGLYPMDTLYYFWNVLRQPDPIQRRIAVSPDSLMLPLTGQAQGFYFDGTLIVSYGVNSRTDSFHQSGIRLLSSRPISVEENGNYYPSKEIVTSGYWGQSEKICNLLPLDYLPPPPDPRYPGLH